MFATPALLLAALSALPVGALDTGRVVIRFEAQDRGPATALSALAESTVDDLCADLGGCDATLFRPPLQVVASPNLAGLRAALGPGVPAWAAGIAMPEQGVAGVRMDPRQGGWGEVERSFRHEMSHLLLHRAVGGRPLPRWFKEGFAMLQAREWSFERARALSSAALSDRLLDLEDLERRFPERRHDITLAYAQASAVVGRLLKSDGDAFVALLAKVRAGEPFTLALESAYQATTGELEARWRDDLNTHYALIPLATGSTTIWTVASLIFLLGYARRRRADRRTLARWEVEEEARAQEFLH